MHLSVHGEVQGSHAWGYEAMLHIQHKMSVIHIALTAGYIRHHQLNHVEGRAKRGWGFQETIWQLSKLLALKHEKNLYGKEYLRMISNLKWPSACLNKIDCYALSQSLLRQDISWTSFPTNKRVITFPCVLRQLSTSVVTQKFCHWCMSSNICSPLAYWAFHSKYTRLFAVSAISENYFKSREKATVSLSTDTQRAVIWKLFL